MSATSTFRVTPGPGPTPVHARPYPAADIIQIRPRDPAPLPVPEETQGPLPSWPSRVLGAVQASCQRLILSLQVRHDLGALDDHQLRDIGLSRDQIQPPLLAVLAANRHRWRW